MYDKTSCPEEKSEKIEIKYSLCLSHELRNLINIQNVMKVAYC